MLRSDRVRVIPGAQGWPVAYEYGVGEKKVRIALEDICHIRAFHPQDDHYGMSPLQAAAAAVDVHNAASRWSKSLSTMPLAPLVHWSIAVWTAWAR